ncbi:MAG TPA: hypothetical protein VN808_17570 [Stellaceae bacterium]|nr:hypothetical protein [Stellaceae bacterium]
MVSTSIVRGWLAATCLALLVSGCSVIPASQFVERYGDPTPTPQNLTLCEGYSCHFGTHVTLSPGEWAQVKAVFEPPAPDAATERDRVARAVETLDLLAAQHTGTAVQQRRDWINKGDPSQIDCVDHTVNTVTYLRLFANAGLLRWNHPGDPAHRGSIIGWDVANTAVLVENDGNRGYSIDTALGDVGLPPYVVPVEQWIAGPIPAFRNNAALPQTYRG